MLRPILALALVTVTFAVTSEVAKAGSAHALPSPRPPSPPPPMPGGCFVEPATDYKFAPGNVFPATPTWPHGLRLAHTAGACCDMCKSFKNCSFWSFEHGGTAAKPTCYQYEVACCILKTAAAAGMGAHTAGVTSGSTKPLPPTPPPPPAPPPPAVQLRYQRNQYGNSTFGIAPAVGRNTTGWSGADPSRWGFEGGKAVEIDGTVHIFTAEMYRAPWNVAMRLAHWACLGGGGACQRVSTLRTSTNDTSGADPLASLWEPVPVYDAAAERWHLFYTGYHSWCSTPDEVTCSPVIYRGNVNGTIYHAVSTTPGLQGVAGPYTGDTAILHCGERGNPPCAPYSLGYNSMHPYGPVDGKWLALLGGAGSTTDVALASAPDLAGPWTVGAPVSFLDPNPPYHPVYVENPVVNPVPAELGGGFMCTFDTGGVAGFGISFSANGTDWNPMMQPVAVPGDVRTPLGIAEFGSGLPRNGTDGADSLSLVYTFSDDHRPFAWGPALPRSGLFEGLFIVDVSLTKLRSTPGQ